MGADSLIAFNLALLAAVIAPGPALLLAMRAGRTGGWRAGFETGLGLATMAALWTLAALLGLDALFTLFPWAYTGMKTAGALYLIWLAWNMWRSAGAPVEAAGARHSRPFLRGFLVNIGNPKSVLFAGAVLVVIFPPNLPPVTSIAIAANHLVLEVAFYALLALAMSRPAVGGAYLRAKRTLDRVTSVILGALGLRLLLER